MAILSKQQGKALSILAALSGAFASPLAEKVETIKHLLGRDTFEWTAFGDSYSSGVGADQYVSGSYRCLRYDHAYPLLINSDDRIPGGDHLFHNAVCSGSSTQDVNDYQFEDDDTSGKPNGQYGDRPAFGQPSMGTLSVGGNDIDFPGIIFNCILETKLPFNAGPTHRSCEDQRQVTWDLLVSPDLADNIDKTIKKVVERARKGPVGNDFKLYVTGFPQFFSTETDECDEVTFARTANPNDDGKEHTRMTQELRKEFNQMSVQLNKAIEDAVSRNQDRGVKWISIDGEMDGHRYCEPGVQEPDQHNDDLWLYHYPYNEPHDDAIDETLQKAFDKVSADVDIATEYKTYNDFQNAVFDAIETDDDDPEANDLKDIFWKAMGHRVKVFHPQVPLHEKIRDLVLEAYVSDLQGENNNDSGGGDEDVPQNNQCFFYMEQYRRCQPSDESFFATLDMRDPSGLRIDEASKPDITAAHKNTPLKVTGGALKEELTAVGKFDKGNKGDNQAMYFTYGDLEWNTADTDSSKPAFCEKPGNWDPEDWYCNGIGKRQFYTEDKDDSARTHRSLACYFEC